VVLVELEVENKSAKPNIFKEARQSQRVEQFVFLFLSFLSLGVASFLEDGLADRMEAQKNEHTTTDGRRTRYPKE
jgi:hypothetical protein